MSEGLDNFLTKTRDKSRAPWIEATFKPSGDGRIEIEKTVTPQTQFFLTLCALSLTGTIEKAKDFPLHSEDIISIAKKISYNLGAQAAEKPLEKLKTEKRDCETWLDVAQHWFKGAFMEEKDVKIEVIERSPQRASIKIITCPYVKLWKRIFNDSLEKCELMCEILGQADVAMAKIINPKMKVSGGCVAPRKTPGLIRGSPCTMTAEIEEDNFGTLKIA